jgi:hypothetical protein
MQPDSATNSEEPDMSDVAIVPAEEEFGLVLVQYAGQWVAVQDRQVLDHDRDLGSLFARLNGERETAEIFRVGDDSAAACRD